MAPVLETVPVGEGGRQEKPSVGSAVHWGRWMGPARDLVNGSADALRTRPVWLFSSGPLGRGMVDPADAAEGNKLLELVGASVTVRN